jgi:hypothetical protein
VALSTIGGRPHRVGAERVGGVRWAVASGLDLAQDDAGIPHPVIEQRVDLRPIRIDHAAAPGVAGWYRAAHQRPADGLGPPQLHCDVALVDASLHECFNHQEVLRS